MIDDIIKTLNSNDLKPEDRVRLMTVIIDKLNYYPISSILEFDNLGAVYVNGKKLEMNQAMLLKNGLDALQNNFADKLVDDQLTYEAIKLGIHNGINTDAIMFSKAVLWVIQERRKLLAQLT